MGGTGEQQSGEACRIDDRRRPRLSGERFVVLRSDHDAQRHAGRQAARRQHDQDRRVVAPRRHDHRLGAGDLHRIQRRIAAGVALQDVDAQPLGQFDRSSAFVDDDDGRRVGTAPDQFGDRLAARRAEAGDDRMAAEALLDHAHPPSVPYPSQKKVIGGSQKDQPHEQPDRRDDERIEQPGLLRHRHDIAVTHRRDRDHREIEDVGEADVAVDIVTQPATVEPVTRKCDADQGKDQADPPQEREPDRRTSAPPQGAGDRGFATRRAAIASDHAVPVRMVARRCRSLAVDRAAAGRRAQSVMAALRHGHRHWRPDQRNLPALPPAGRKRTR